MERFPTGLEHFVYDVELGSGRPLVLRIATPENRRALAGAVFWHPRLRSVGIPIARILHADVEAPLPFLALERLPGTDLGHVYDQLPAGARGELARRVAELQERAGGLPEARGFGYALDYDARLAAAWADVLRGSLERSRRWIEHAGLVDPRWVERVESCLARAGVFGDVRPRAFLHDTTTKNVIVYQGSLSGIVDVDSMGFGDPLWTVALTRMSLLAEERPTDYVDAWCAELDPDAAPRERLDLYTALHGLGFLGELGRAFNENAPFPDDPGVRVRLEQLLDSLLRSLA